MDQAALLDLMHVAGKDRATAWLQDYPQIAHQELVDWIVSNCTPPGLPPHQAQAKAEHIAMRIHPVNGPLRDDSASLDP
jgi:hypothetical protein